MKSLERSYIGPRDVRPLSMTAEDVANFSELQKLGICFDENDVVAMVDGMRKAGYAMDAAPGALQPTVTTGTVSTPVQFLQAWLPGFARIITQARKIDEMVGILTAGSWEDEEVVQGVMEQTGKAQPYGDANNIPLTSFNPNFERRTIVRFESGMNVGRLEEARAAKMRASAADEKRAATGLSLEIQRNAVGFYGYNNGSNRTYGFLNDPSLPAYVSVANPGGAGTTWATKTFLQITADLRTAFAALRSRSGDNIDPENTPITIGIATAAVDYLTVTSDFGISVRDWIRTTYPKARIVSAPELSAANGGENVFYMFAEEVNDGASDDSRTFVQVVPAKVYTLGVHQMAKSYVEDFANATAGVMLKRPYAVVRYTGI